MSKPARHKRKAQRTFFLYRVVFATANTPFRIALVLRWCRITWLGTGNTLASSARPGASSFATFARRFDGVCPSSCAPSSPAGGGLDAAAAIAPTSVPEAVVTGSGAPSAVLDVIPSVDGPCERLARASRSRRFARSFSLSFSRRDRSRSLGDPGAPLICGRTLRMSLSRCRGSTGAGGTFGAGTLLDVDGESALARYASSSAAALMSSCGMTVVHSASCPSGPRSAAVLEASLQNEANWLTAFG